MSVVLSRLNSICTQCIKMGLAGGLGHLQSIFNYRNYFFYLHSSINSCTVHTMYKARRSESTTLVGWVTWIINMFVCIFSCLDMASQYGSPRFQIPNGSWVQVYVTTSRDSNQMRIPCPHQLQNSTTFCPKNACRDLKWEIIMCAIWECNYCE